MWRSSNCGLRFRFVPHSIFNPVLLEINCSDRRVRDWKTQTFQSFSFIMLLNSKFLAITIKFWHLYHTWQWAGHFTSIVSSNVCTRNMKWMFLPSCFTENKSKVQKDSITLNHKTKSKVFFPGFFCRIKEISINSWKAAMYILTDNNS